MKTYGHESVLHATIKKSLKDALQRKGLIVVEEHLRADLAVLNPRTGVIICIEIELSEKHLEANLRRNFRNGADAVFSLCVSRSRPTP